jgi:hypothetical protein
MRNIQALTVAVPLLKKKGYQAFLCHETVIELNP